MSKGDKRRPMNISRQEWDEKFKSAFSNEVDFPDDNLEPVDTPDKDLDDFIKRPDKKFSWRKTKDVLRNVMNSPIMGFIIQLTPKPIKTMLKWLKERFKEPSTYQGIAVVAGAIGFSISPELWESIAAVAASIIGLIQVIKRERKEEDKE